MVKYLTLVVLRYSCKISDFVHFSSSSHHHTNAGFWLSKDLRWSMSRRFFPRDPLRIYVLPLWDYSFRRIEI